LKPLVHAALAQVAASAAIVAAPVIERLFAVTLGAGAVSRLEYAMRLLVIPATIFEGALVPLLLAQWTQQITTDGRGPTKGEVLTIVGRGFSLAAALGILLAACAQQLVHILLGHGRFGAADEEAVVSVLRLLSLAFVANMTAQLLERHYIATTRNRTLAALSVGRALVRLGLALSLLDSLGLRAFAVGFAVSDWCYVAALMSLLRPAPTIPSPLVLGSND
jgi:putative peptidoglycan lipid II flippase